MSKTEHLRNTPHPQAALEGATLSSDYCLLMIDYWARLQRPLVGGNYQDQEVRSRVFERKYPDAVDISND